MLALVSRGAVPLHPRIRKSTSTKKLYKSPIEDVSSEAWTKFVRAMQVGKLSTISKSNGLGLFEMKPKRLSDLGFMKDVKSENGKSAFIGTFTEDAKKYMQDADIQYKSFVLSMKDYATKIKNNEIKIPKGETLAGTLAILHRAGPKGLEKEIFSHTRRLRDTVKDLF